MTSSTGTGETKKKEPKEKKPGMVATITAVTAMLTAGGTLVKDIQGQHEQELIQKSVFNYATAQTAEIRERLAKLEAHIEWLRHSAAASMPPAMVSVPEAGHPECATDGECEVTQHCVEGKCEEPVAEEVSGVGGAAHVEVDVASPPAPPPSRRPKGKPAKFEDIKDFVQMEQRAWPAE